MSVFCSPLGIFGFLIIFFICFGSYEGNKIEWRECSLGWVGKQEMDAKVLYQKGPKLMDLGFSCCFSMVCTFGVGKTRAALMEVGCH